MKGQQQALLCQNVCDDGCNAEVMQVSELHTLVMELGGLTIRPLSPEVTFTPKKDIGGRYTRITSW